MTKAAELATWAVVHGWPQLRFGVSHERTHGILVGPGEYSWRRFLAYSEPVDQSQCWLFRDRASVVEPHGAVVGYEVDASADDWPVGQRPRCALCMTAPARGLPVDEHRAAKAARFEDPQFEPICSGDRSPIPLYCGPCGNWIPTIVEGTAEHSIPHLRLRRNENPRLRIRRYLDEEENEWRDVAAAVAPACDCCDWPALGGYYIDPLRQSGARSSGFFQESLGLPPPRRSKYARIGGRLVAKLCPDCLNHEEVDRIGVVGNGE